MQPERIIQIIADWAKAQPTVQAVALVGSHARGSADADSDIDLVMIVTNPRAFRAEAAWLDTIGWNAVGDRPQKWQDAGIFQSLLAAMIERARKRLTKRAKRGFRGWPLATVALYGPDDTTATKLTVGIVPGEDAEATDLRRWLSKDQTDIRDDIRATEEVLAFITEAGAKSVVMADRIIGCPHEEGIDYEGATCPACPFWAGRDRWTGKRLH